MTGCGGTTHKSERPGTHGPKRCCVARSLTVSKNTTGIILKNHRLRIKGKVKTRSRRDLMITAWKKSKIPNRRKCVVEKGYPATARAKMTSCALEEASPERHASLPAVRVADGGHSRQCGDTIFWPALLPRSGLRSATGSRGVSYLADLPRVQVSGGSARHQHLLKPKAACGDRRRRRRACARRTYAATATCRWPCPPCRARSGGAEAG